MSAKLPARPNLDHLRRQAKTLLAPRLNLIVEYSNEPWNYGFSQAHWMREQARLAWPDQIAKGKSDYELQPSWYAMRSAQMCQIIKKEFGADASRVKCMFNGQASNSWISADLDKDQCVFRASYACATNTAPLRNSIAAIVASIMTLPLIVGGSCTGQMFRSGFASR